MPTCPSALAAVAYRVDVEGPVWNRIFPFLDAAALGCCAAAGAQKTLEAGWGWLPAILLGTMTAVGCGTVRDVVSHRTPGIVGGPRHVTCALVAAGVLVVLNRSGLVSAGLVTAALGGGGLTLLARWRDWQLPQPHRWRPVTALAQDSDDWLRRGRGRSRAAGESSKHTGQAETSSDEPREQP